MRAQLLGIALGTAIGGTAGATLGGLGAIPGAVLIGGLGGEVAAGIPLAIGAFNQCEACYRNCVAQTGQ